MQKEAMILRKSRESIWKGLVEGKGRKKCNYIIISFFKPVSIGKQPQAINIHKEEAAVTNLYTYSSIVYKHLSFHTPSAFTFGPKEGFAISLNLSGVWVVRGTSLFSWVWSISPWHGRAHIKQTFTQDFIHCLHIHIRLPLPSTNVPH